MTVSETPSLEEIICGTYSHSRYRGKLGDFRVRVRAKHVREGKPETSSCALILAGKQAVREGAFPEAVSDIEVIGVSGVVEGVTMYPEMHFAATFNRSGRRILCKAVSRDVLALQIVSCNDLGTTDLLAERIAASHSPVTVRFTDVRYTPARTGSYLPEDPGHAFVRELSNNAVRNSATADEAVARVSLLAPEYAAKHGVPPEKLPELTERVAQLAASRAPGKRDRSGEVPIRTPARRSQSTTERWK